MVIINTPHNPTGRIYDGETLKELADLLERASAADQPTDLPPLRRALSPPALRRHGFNSPASFYPWTLISYSYGKVLLAPGQRLGYLAISPLMPTADRRRFAKSSSRHRWRLAGAFPMR